MKNSENSRLFVPLASAPFEWFATGRKRWELRRYGRQYTTRHVVPGRRVELRRGYQDAQNALWGTIVAVRQAKGIKEFFRQVPFAEVIPIAASEEEAVRIASEILAPIEPFGELLGFCIEFEERP